MNIKKTDCSGCMACENVCPAHCIQIRTTTTGNFIRFIDDSHCRHCGRCETVCPTKESGWLSMPQKAYLAWSKKADKRSSSGGIAASIYRYCLSHHMECVGVKYDEALSARYDFVRSMEDMPSFAGSKYVYSHMDSIYQNILTRLKDGKKIVFIGLPCHVAALKNITDMMGYQSQIEASLICIDLVCHGVPAEKFLSEHLNHMRRKMKDTDIVSIEFREGKNPFGVTLRGRQNRLLKRQPCWRDEYMLGYCTGFIYCESCYNCQYAQKKRCSDLTIKDFSGVRRPNIIPDQTRGISNIFVNTDKGNRFIKELEPYLNLIDYSVEAVIAEDDMLRRPTPRGKRNWFLKLYPLFGFDKSVCILCFPVMLKGKIENRLGTTVKTLGLAAAAGSLMSKNTDRLKALSDKHLAMFLLMNEWMKTKQAGKHICDYLAKNGYKSVAVYGLSYVGERLLEELKECDVRIAYAVDRHITSSCWNIEIISPESALPKADVLIVTPVYFFDEIYNSLVDKVTYPIVSLEDVLSELKES